MSCVFVNSALLVLRYMIFNMDLLSTKIEVSGSMVLLEYLRYKSVGKTTSFIGPYFDLLGTTNTGHCTFVMIFRVLVPIGILVLLLVPFVPITMRSISCASTIFRILSINLPVLNKLSTWWLGFVNTFLHFSICCNTFSTLLA